MKFSKFESSLYLYLSEALGSEKPLQAFEIPNGYRAGYFQVGEDKDPINLIFSFPLESDDCYLTFSDGDAKKISLELASVQSYNEQTAHLCSMHTVKTQNSYFNDHNWIALLITIPAMALDDLPSIETVGNRELRFHLVVPLNETHYGIKLENGYDALLDYFENTNRDIVAFDA
ncbi:suppressor of fused domain protein [Shewanella basaltis]|uniref:suppressor of fused domain protein n=1 Tax=Alteromonadales TaxID=135622 RepID=UPI001067EDA9|nr:MULTISPECIES: suppressor of fused domain protein [Alteromonadales]MCL1112642.1 suppressor of fused domain protein [Shewanella basaltis]TEW48272.1 hypothetical protein E2R67_11695 [Psychromonas sp. RZ5]